MEHFRRQIDSSKIVEIAKTNSTVTTLISSQCKDVKVNINTTKTQCKRAQLLKPVYIIHHTCTSDHIVTLITGSPYMFSNVRGVWEDWVIGLILLVIALFILCVCLVLIVKVLTSIFRGPIAVVIKKVVNSDFPGKSYNILTSI